MSDLYDEGYELQDPHRQTKPDMTGATILECKHYRWHTDIKIKHTDGTIEDVVFSSDSHYTSDSDGIAVLRK